MPVIPHNPKVVEIANHVGVLVTAVCESTESVLTLTDVGQHGCIIEHRVD